MAQFFLIVPSPLQRKFKNMKVECIIYNNNTSTNNVLLDSAPVCQTRYSWHALAWLPLWHSNVTRNEFLPDTHLSHLGTPYTSNLRHNIYGGHKLRSIFVTFIPCTP